MAAQDAAQQGRTHASTLQEELALTNLPVQSMVTGGAQALMAVDEAQRVNPEDLIHAGIPVPGITVTGLPGSGLPV